MITTTLESDNVFSDGWDLQLATVTGDVDAGYQVSIDVPIDTSTQQEAPEQPGGEGPGGADGAGRRRRPPAGGARRATGGRAPTMPSDGGPTRADPISIRLPTGDASGPMR